MNARAILAHQVQAGQYVNDRKFYGTVERVEYPCGTQTVRITTQGGYVFTVQRNAQLTIS